jgi:uncharacterized protein (TIGR00661 family)
MKVMFTVQGDGRGHMTQAIALKEMLELGGHRVVAVLAGQNQSRTLPAFFTGAFNVPVEPFSSPGFTLKHGKAISTLRSVLHFFANVRAYSRSLAAIEATIGRSQPDLIVNFLEPLAGYYNLRRRPKVPVLSVAHHFMFEHPRYPRVHKFGLQALGMRFYVRLTGANASRLALSFYPGEDLPERRIFVCPPILRRQLFELRPDPLGQYILVYLLNHGYETEIEAWHRQHPEVPIHCFYDKPGAPPEERRTANLTFHALHGEKYLRLMAGCLGVVCTAGFESISEAAYLGKRLLMVPVQNHPEQTVNALDAQLAGLGVYDKGFHLSRLLEPMNAKASAGFKQWVDQAGAVAVRAAEVTAARGTWRPATAALAGSPGLRKKGEIRGPGGQEIIGIQ